MSDENAIDAFLLEVEELCERYGAEINSDCCHLIITLGEANRSVGSL